MPAVPITVPSVGESITEGIVSRWLRPDGSVVEEGEPVLELETDKATTTLPAPGSGVLKIGAEEGAVVAVGSAVGTIDTSAEARAAAPPPGKPSAAPAERPERPAPAERQERPTPTAAPAERQERPTPATDDGLRVSPAVRRLAAEQDVDLSRVAGSGPGGRITKEDLLNHIETTPGAAAPPIGAPRPATPWPTAHNGGRAAASATAPTSAPAFVSTSAPGPRETRQRMSGLRQRIAQRLVEAQHTAAILTTFNEADLSRVMDLRARFKEPFQKKHGVSLGFMSFFIKASIEALKAFPAVNGRIEGNEIIHQNFYDIGVAVSTERGLMVPIVRDADRLSFAEIEKAIAGYAAKARDGAIAVDDLRGGTFTITNGGTFGSMLSTPILNPPQSGILGMHAIKKRPVVIDDQIVVRPMMYLALSYDHRLIDGREAVSFLVKVRDCLEAPERMMLDV